MYKESSETGIFYCSACFSNKLQLVVDASRHINLYVKKRKVKLDSLDDFSFLVQERDFLKFIIKSKTWRQNNRRPNMGI